MYVASSGSEALRYPRTVDGSTRARPPGPSVRRSSPSLNSISPARTMYSSSWRSWKCRPDSYPGGSTTALTPNAWTPSSERILRNPGPSPRPSTLPTAQPSPRSVGVAMARHTRRVPEPIATLEELLQPLKADPSRSAVLLDVDGVLAPIVQHPDDAHMPETTRRPLIEVAKRYGVVACVSGRRASDARRVVSLGSIAYLGSHGSEILRPGSISPEMDRELQAWTRRVQNFAREAYSESLRKLRVRPGGKGGSAGPHRGRGARQGGGGR